MEFTAVRFLLGRVGQVYLFLGGVPGFHVGVDTLDGKPFHGHHTLSPPHIAAAPVLC